MSNMSYCRFQNTLNDLRDCAYAMSEDYEEEESLSMDEVRARDNLIALCGEIAEQFPDGEFEE